MKTSPARSRLMPLISSAASWAAGLVGGLWFARADGSAREAIPLAAVLALTVVAGVTWRQFRARARRRLQAALDAYAEREINHERRRTALKRARTLSTALGITSSVGKQLKPRTHPAPSGAE